MPLKHSLSRAQHQRLSVLSYRHVVLISDKIQLLPNQFLMIMLETRREMNSSCQQEGCFKYIASYESCSGSPCSSPPTQQATCTLIPTHTPQLSGHMHQCLCTIMPLSYSSACVRPTCQDKPSYPGGFSCMGNILAVTLGSRLSLEQEVSAPRPLELVHWLCYLQ